MPDQIQQARDAIEKIREAHNRIRQEALDLRDSDDYKKGRDEARQRYKELIKKQKNLRAVYRALRGADIKKGATRPSNALGTTDKTKDPAVVTLSERHIDGLSIEVIAQILAHEAIHLLSKSPYNSLEQEVRCRKKEVEVWELLKGDDPLDGDFHCNMEQANQAKSEKDYKWFIYWLYVKSGIYLPAKDIPPKSKKKGKLKKWKARSIGSQLFDLTVDYISNALRLIFIGHHTEKEYSFETSWPAGYVWQEAEGSHEVYNGIFGLKRNKNEILPATISVTEEPDIIHGGEWPNFVDCVEYQRDILSSFNVDTFDPRTEIIRDVGFEVAGQAGHCLETEFDIPVDDSNPDEWRTRVRTRTYYTQRGTTLFSISMSCLAENWETHEPDLIHVLENFRFNS